MIILLLLLFFKSICLYCQRVVLHIYDQWINPKNTRQLKEAIETKGSRLGYKYIYNQDSCVQPRRRRRTLNLDLNSTGLFTARNTEYCNFCVHTPQGYCRHHFHLQELHIHKLQQQQQRHEQYSLWFPLKNNVEESLDLKQLRKIKRHLKSYLQEQQQRQQQYQQQHQPQRQQQQQYSTRAENFVKSDNSNNSREAQCFNSNGQYSYESTSISASYTFPNSQNVQTCIS